MAETPDSGWRLENTYASLPGALFQRVRPARVPMPRMVIFNRSLAESLGLNAVALDTDEGALLLGGGGLPPGSDPIAQAYAGHQYGRQTMLGDGRAVLLGEQITPQNARIDIQLKGSGRTPYSRNGDGKAALGPMLREYVISEAMQGFGIPTTRSLAVVSTGERVFRQEEAPGAVLARTAASHIRVGTFEYAAAVPDPGVLRALADHVLGRHYPGLGEAEHPHRALFAAIRDRQAELIVRWMGVGFVHGVMNTDNMAVSGETIDFGPCAFLDSYHPDAVFSSIDRYGRYAYGRQPEIAHWNLTRLAEAMLPLFAPAENEAVDVANEMLSEFPARFQKLWMRHFGAKLGLFDVRDEDRPLIEDFLLWMRDTKADFTNTFRSLDSLCCAQTVGPSSTDPTFAGWHARWTSRLREQARELPEAVALMRKNNPVWIPRNHRVEEALQAAETSGDLEPLHVLLSVVSAPFQAHPGREEWMLPAPAGSPPYVTYCGT